MVSGEASGETGVCLFSAAGVWGCGAGADEAGGEVCGVCGLATGGGAALWEAVAPLPPEASAGCAPAVGSANAASSAARQKPCRNRLIFG